MKHSILYLMTAAVLLAGCAKEVDKTQVPEIPAGMHAVTITASVDNLETRTSVEIVNKKGIYSWQENEQIAVVETLTEDENGILPFQILDQENGTFTGSMTDGESLVFAVTPKDALTDVECFDETDLAFTLSLSGIYNFSDGTNAVMVAGLPTYAEGSENPHFTFQHAAALYRVVYENVPMGTAALHFDAKGKPITGDFIFDSLEGVEILQSDANLTSGHDYADVLLDAPVSSPNTTLTFYVPVPTGTYSNVTVSLLDEELDAANPIASTTRSFEAGADYPVSKGQIVRIPKITLAPVEITKGAEHVLTITKDNKFSGYGVELKNDNVFWVVNKVNESETGAVGNYDSNHSGQQFGTSSNGLTALTVSTSNYSACCSSSNAIGIKDITVTTSSNSGKEFSVSVTVGGVAMTSSDNTHTAAANTAYSSHFTSEELLTGEVVITHTNKTASAIYICSVEINPVIEPTANPSISCSDNVITITCETEGATIYYTVGSNENSTPDPTNESAVYDPEDKPTISEGDGYVKAFAVANGYSASEIVGASVTYVAPSAPTYYVKVISAPSDWSGEYLMVCESVNEALSRISDTSTKYGIGSEVVIEDSQIASSPKVDAYKITIAKATGNASGYTLSLSNLYLCWTSGNSLATTNTENNNARWTLSAGETSGNWKITNVADNNRVIWYNTSSPRFACYTDKGESSTGYAPIQLYRYIDTPETRDPAPIAWKKGGEIVSEVNVTWSENGFSTSLPTLDAAGLGDQITISSTNQAVATVNEGAVTIIGGGSTVINATYTADEESTYKTTTVSYALTVTDNRPTVATPTFDPVAGTVAAGTEISISCETQGATIHYTDDGSVPTAESPVYTMISVITIDETKTIKAIAVKANCKNSAVATAEYEVSVNSSTEDNPYTASEAIVLASTYGSDIPDVYVKGIVCQEGTISNGSVNYYVSDDGAPDNKFEMYKGKYINGSNFTDATNVKLGDFVVAKGTLTYYNNSQAELSAGNEVISILRAPLFSPAGGVYGEVQTVTLSADSGAAIYYTTDGSTPTTSSSEFSSSAPIAVTESMTIKAIAVKGGVSTGVATAVYTINANTNDGSLEKPFTADEAYDLIVGGNAPTGNKYVSGQVVSKNQSLSSGKLSYYISSDGTTSKQIQVYLGKYLANSNFTSVDQLPVGAEVVVYGELLYYNNTKAEINSGNYIYSLNGKTKVLAAPTVTAGQVGIVKQIKVDWTTVTDATSYMVECGDASYTAQSSETSHTFTVESYDTYAVRVTAKADNAIDGVSAPVDVVVVAPSLTAVIKSGESATSIPAAGATRHVTVGGNVAWTASITGGATLQVGTEAAATEITGTGEAEVTVNIPANNDTDNGKEYTFSIATEVSGVTAPDDIVFSQIAKSSGDNPQPVDKNYSFAFSVIGQTGWSNSYADHDNVYNDDVVSISLKKSCKQTSTITAYPVTKAGDVVVVLKDGTMSAVTFSLTQWSDKAKTVSLQYSTDGGSSYSALNPAVSSSNFTLTASSLPSGTNAVKLVQGNTSNQVGLIGVSFTYTPSN